MNKKLLTIIVPCYNEEESLPLFYQAIKNLEGEGKLSAVDIEFLFVDDGSRDKTLQVCRQLRSQDERVRYVSFSRNFGKEAGIYAGLEKSRGDYVGPV